MISSTTRLDLRNHSPHAHRNHRVTLSRQPSQVVSKMESPEFSPPGGHRSSRIPFRWNSHVNLGVDTRCGRIYRSVEHTLRNIILTNQQLILDAAHSLRTGRIDPTGRRIEQHRPCAFFCLAGTSLNHSGHRNRVSGHSPFSSRQRRHIMISMIWTGLGLNALRTVGWILFRRSSLLQKASPRI